MDGSDDVMVVGGMRTPFGRFGGKLRSVPSVELGAFAIRAALERCKVAPENVDELYYGGAVPAEEALDGAIPARVALLKAGLPETTLSLNIDRGCCSSMTGVHLAAHSLRAGRARLAIVGGAENMCRAAFLISPEVRWGIGRHLAPPTDPMAALGADGRSPLARDAGEVALEYGIDRGSADAWAVASHAKYLHAKAAGFHRGDIVSYTGGEATLLEEDELPAADTTLESLSALETVPGSPTITAGNAASQGTGACFTVLATRRRCHEIGLEPLARLRSTGAIARSPGESAVAAAPAIAKALEPLGWSVATLDRIEINESFACVALACARLLAEGDRAREQDILDKLNVNGGAVAIGHPAGASGARLLLTLTAELRRRGGGRGAAAIAGALGMADAVGVESV